MNAEGGWVKLRREEADMVKKKGKLEEEYQL